MLSVSSGTLVRIQVSHPRPFSRDIAESGAHKTSIDENRARVVESGRIHAIIELLSEDSLLPFVIPVLYNVLVDYGKDLLPAYTHKNVHFETDFPFSQNLSSCKPARPG